jgi:hypothetical protein
VAAALAQRSRQCAAAIHSGETLMYFDWFSFAIGAGVGYVVALGITAWRMVREDTQDAR